MTFSFINLRSKVIYNVLMVPISIKSVFKYISITGSYYPIRKAVSKVKIMQIVSIS